VDTLVPTSDEQIFTGASSGPGISVLNQLSYTRILFRLIVISWSINALVLQRRYLGFRLSASYSSRFNVVLLTGAHVNILLVVLKRSNISLSK
jgi:hypothetical protein